VDFGTTNSAAAIFDGSKVAVVQLERDSAIMPSASYIDTEFTVRTGNDAIQTYIEQNRGRRVELKAEVLGEGRFSTGEIEAGSGLPSAASTETIYGREVDDAGLPGRLFHGIKRLLGSRDAERVVIFQRPFRLVALITPVLVRIRAEIERSLRARFPETSKQDPECATHACIGFPVRFEGSERAKDDLAIARLSEAYRHAGAVEQTFCPEPIAAAIGYLFHHPPQGGCRALAVDFGGGTLDLCVIRYEDSTLEVETIHGIALGGNKIDQALCRELVFPLLGKGASWRRSVGGREIETAFPFWMYEERLLNWQVTYTLNQNKYTTALLDQIGNGGAGAQALERLYHLIAQNYGYETFRCIRSLKESLSVEPAGMLDISEIDVHARLTRDEFERMIADEIHRFEEAVDVTLRNAALGPEDIDLVLRTGGSALIPAFAGILKQRFPGKVVEQDPFTSVAAGLSIADYYGFGSEIA
jgi:hypothetical chaperone protein